MTLLYEGHAEVSDDVRYEFSDLRRLPYRDGWFSSVVCLSTLERRAGARTAPAWVSAAEGIALVELTAV